MPSLKKEFKNLVIASPDLFADSQQLQKYLNFRRLFIRLTGLIDRGKMKGNSFPKLRIKIKHQ